MGFVFPIIALLLSFQAWAWPPTFGTEYNFASFEMAKAWRARGEAVGFKGREWQNPSGSTIEQRQATRMMQEVQRLCADCEITSHQGKWANTEYDVKTPKGYHFNISIDPGCVEVQTFPESTADLGEHEAEAQKLIFQASSRVGMRGDGAAHLNIGLASAFDDDAKSFLRFFTNYHNLPELSSGALGNDHYNAPVLSQLSSGQKRAFRKLLGQVNSGDIKSAKVLAALLQSQVYLKTPFVKDGGGHHYQGISVKQINKKGASGDQPFELRGIFQPSNAHERTLLSELLEKRMAFDKAQAGPVVFYDQEVISDQNLKAKRTRYAGSELKGALKIYVEDAGAKLEDYQALLPPEVRGARLDRLLSGTLDFTQEEDLALLKHYVPLLTFSPTVREKMGQVLKNAELKERPGFAESLAAIRQMKSGASAEARRMFNDFLAEVDPVSSKGIWGTCAGFFRQL